jgi:hypothetical protein
MEPTPEPVPPTLIGPPRQPSRAERRLRAKLDQGERLVMWTQGWISRDGRMHALLAARTLDFAVITDRRLCLFATGFFSRLPRRRVYENAFESLQVSPTGTQRGHRLRITSRRHRPILLENHNTEHNVAFALELVVRTRSPIAQ